MPDTPGHDPSTVGPRFEEVVEQFLREREAGRKKPEEQAEVLVLEKTVRRAETRCGPAETMVG